MGKEEIFAFDFRSCKRPRHRDIIVYWWTIKFHITHMSTLYYFCMLVLSTLNYFILTLLSGNDSLLHMGNYIFYQWIPKMTQKNFAIHARERSLTKIDCPEGVKVEQFEEDQQQRFLNWHNFTVGHLESFLCPLNPAAVTVNTPAESSQCVALDRFVSTTRLTLWHKCSKNLFVADGLFSVLLLQLACWHLIVGSVGVGVTGNCVLLW